MGQFDSPSEAALTQLTRGTQYSSSAGDVTFDLCAIIADLAGVRGASSIKDLFIALKGGAAKKDESNLLYFAEAVVDDIRRLYSISEEVRRRSEETLKSEKFQVAVENATLHIVRTNVKTRLKRLARIVTNSVRDSDLEAESLDDMMWYAVNLAENDVTVLGIVYEMQRDLLTSENLSKHRGQRTNELQRKWQVWWGEHIADYRGLRGLEFQNSCGRLQAAGLVGPMPKSSPDSPVQDDCELFLTGLRFYDRLREI